MATILVVIAFLAGAGLVLALGSAVRDLSSRRYNQVDRRLRLDAAQPEIAAFYREKNVHQGRIDEWFYRLVSESGVGFDVPTTLTLVVGCGLIGAAIPYVVWENPLGVAVGISIGILLPLAWLSFQRWRRIRVMRNVLPEALQIVADAVRAGHSLEDASAMVADDLAGPLSQEFEQCASQLRLGNSPTSVMEQMARRIPMPEFRVFSTAVMVHEKAGGNLALLTERLSLAARERQEFMGHVNAVTAGSRLSAGGLILASIIAMCALVWLEPEYVIAFVNNDMGPTLLAVAIGLQLIGILWVWRLIRVSY